MCLPFSFFAKITHYKAQKPFKVGAYSKNCLI